MKNKPYTPPIRKPCYGTQVEKELLEAVQLRIRSGLSIDNTMLRQLLIRILEANNKSDLLRENGGHNTFGLGFASRFWKRNNLVGRVATTKMRAEMPADFEQKKQDYLRVASTLYHTHGMECKEDLIYGFDETNALFAPRANKTRATKGEKRIRVNRKRP